MFRRSWFVTLPAGLIALTIGCGGPSDAVPKLSLNPVKGKVLLEDGKPVTSGQVVFVSTTTGISPNGKIGPDGSFTLSSGGQGDGAPAGEYKVKIEPATALGTSDAKPRPGAKLPYSGIYADEDTSGLKVTVKDGDNSLEPFKLSTKQTAVVGSSNPNTGRSGMRD